MYSLLKSSIRTPIISNKINLYTRYIKQFIHAPFQSEFRGITNNLSISEILKLDIDVFVELKYIKELQSGSDLYNRRRPTSTFDWFR